MIKIRPRNVTFDVATARLRELGVTVTGYDHHESCYAGVVIPPGVKDALSSDPLIEVEWDGVPKQPRATPVWSSALAATGMANMGMRLRETRTRAGLDLPAAARQTNGALSADAIERIEATGECDLRQLIVLADVYGVSLDKIAGRAVARGDRRR